MKKLNNEYYYVEGSNSISADAFPCLRKDKRSDTVVENNIPVIAVLAIQHTSGEDVKHRL